jgi:regulator of protease activity HflC (stomatin/prohibitin superfamily)
MERRTPDASVTDAIDRVLAAEREAADAIVSAEREAEGIIEAARARRRQILDTTRRRASALHARAQAQLARELQRLESDQNAPGTGLERLRELSREAIEGLARRMTVADHEPD